MRNLLISLLLLASSLQAESLDIPAGSLSESFNCARADEDLLEIIIIKGLKKPVHFPYFMSSGLISKKSSCQRFLESWPKALIAEKVLSFRAALESANQAERDELLNANVPENLQRFSNGEIAAWCEKLGYCTVLRAGIPLTSGEKYCSPKFTWERYFDLVRPRSLNVQTEYIKEVELAVHPFQPFTQILKDEIKSDNRPSLILASTMTAGTYSTNLINQALAEAKKEAIIALDGTLVMRNNQLLIAQQFLKQDRGFLLPMVPDGRYKNAHHWKILLADGAPESVLSSMNIANPYKAPYSDFSYKFRDEAVTSELRGILVGAMKEQCAAPEDVACLAKFALDSQEEKVWQELYAKACSKVAAISPSPLRARRFFMQPADTDLVYKLVQLFDSAQSEIVLLSHQVSVNDLIVALERARARGVRVYVLAGERLESKIELPGIYYPRFDPQNNDIPIPHMKAAIIDREVMFFGTGNFTESGLMLSRELFALTKDKRAIKKAIAVAAAIYRMAVGKSNFLPDADAEERLVIQEAHVKRDTKLQEKFLHRTAALKEEWLKDYRAVDPQNFEKLRACNIAGLPFVAASALLNCIDD